MLRTFLLSFVVLSSSVHAKGPYWSFIQTNTPNNNHWQSSCATCSNEEETFYFEHVGGSFSTYPSTYIKVFKNCRGLSTNLDKMLLRALKNSREESLRRLNCAVKGLDVDLLTYKIQGKTLIELAEAIENRTIIEYINNL